MIAPSVADERLIELRNRGFAAQPQVAWKTHGPFVSLLFFVLTIIGVVATGGFFDLIELPNGTFLTGLLAVALAEFLMQRRRFFGTGVESALWIAGSFAFIFALPGPSRAEGLLLFAVASAAAGFRVRNALFGALAVVFVIAYFMSTDFPTAAALIAMAVSMIALVALAREWQRPSTEKLWIALHVIPPITLLTTRTLEPWWAIVYVLLAAVCVAAGLWMRAHTPFIGAAIYATADVTTLAAHDLLPFDREWSLIMGGAALMAASAFIARDLRGRTRGIVVSPEAMTRFDEEMQILATIGAQPATQPHVETDREGGRFGGAGATGDY